MDKMQTINLDPLMMARGLINMDTNISIPKKKIYNKKKIALGYFVILQYANSLLMIFVLHKYYALCLAAV